MKATIYIDGKVIFSSNRISSARLEKVTNEMKHKHGCIKMPDIVKRNFAVTTSN